MLISLGLLSIQNLVNSVAIFVGWIVALLIVWIQLKKTREDSQILKREEIRKSLEINAFKEINKAITDFSDILSAVAVYYRTLPGRLQLHMKSPDIFQFSGIKEGIKINSHPNKLYEGVGEYILSIEGNEIAVIEFDHLRKYIQFRVDDVIDLIRDFQWFVINANMSELETTKKTEFDKRCGEILEQLGTIQSYLFDYRIELMNYFLGDIFFSKVPHRKPKDPKYKILTEVATKEEVQREAEERERKALKRKE